MRGNSYSCRFAVSLLAAFALSACGASVNVLTTDDGADWIEDDWEADRVECQKKGSVQLAVVMPEAYGCVWTMSLKDGGKGKLGLDADWEFGYYGCPLTPVQSDEDDWVDDMEVAMEKAIAEGPNAIPAEGYVSGASVIEGVRDLVRAVVKHRFEERFARVRVQLVDEKQPAPAINLFPRHRFLKHAGTKMTLLELKAEMDGCDPIVVAGEGLDKTPDGQVAGLITCVIVGLPLSLAFTHGIWLPELHENVLAASIARAWDEAAKDMAEKVAARRRSGPSGAE